jgi:hypothetical protein
LARTRLITTPTHPPRPQPAAPLISFTICNDWRLRQASSIPELEDAVPIKQYSTLELL